MQSANDDRLELALRASNEGIWRWNVADGSVNYSERVLDFLGHSGEEVPNLFVAPHPNLHEEDVVEFEAALAQMLDPDGSEIFAVDTRYIRPDGVVAWLRIRGACVHDEEGKVTCVAGSMIDISRRKKAEIALDAERHLLFQLIENIPNNIYFKDLDSRFVMVNRATAQKMGFVCSKEIIGKTDHDFFDDSHADKSRADELKIMMTQEAQRESLEREIWEGQEDTWVLTTKIPWLDRHGEVRGTFGVSSDVSDMVNVQVRLTNVANELKHRNTEYEKELELARQIQQSVLVENPAPFPSEGTEAAFCAEFSTHYEPDSEMTGDFYEIFEISDTQVGVLICDVMGHGVRAALVVAMLRGLIEKETSSVKDPEWFLYGLNDSLARIFSHAGIQMFATALYLVIDVSQGTLEYASAGHPMPIVLKDGESSILKSEKIVRGPALGLMAEAPYGSDVIKLTELDQLILFTDGIYEVENPQGDELGVKGLLECLSGQPPANGPEVLKRIVKRASDHSEVGSYGDDICLLALDFFERTARS